MPIKHKKFSLIQSTGDPALVQPSDWNDDHILSGSLDFSGVTNILIPNVTLIDNGVPATPPPGQTTLFGKLSDGQLYSIDSTGHVSGPFGSTLIPNTHLAFSATPSFAADISRSYDMTLTGNVSASSITGSPVNGTLLSLTLIQDAIGGWTFAFPGNFVFPAGYTFDTVALHTNALTFKFDGTNWSLLSNAGTSGGGGGGVTPVGADGDLQMRSGSGLAASHINDNGSLLKLTEDAAFKANPYTDVRQYGVRAVTATPTTTVTTTSGSPNVTLAAASTFINGDGVAIISGGAANALATPAAPTVVASNSINMLGTGLTAANGSGGTTYQYCIVARTLLGSMTPCSATTTIVNGAATLGVQTVNIASWTRSNNLVTVVTSTPHALVINTMVYINAAGIEGWFTVNTVPDSTHFTYLSNLDTRNGAQASGGASGTVLWWQGNHISWAPITGAFQYLIYGRSGGAMNLIGVSYPESKTFGLGTFLDNDPLYNTFDDWGTTITPAITGPLGTPTTAPVAAKNANFTTTIVSGAGTTSLVLADNVPSTVAGNTFIFDNAKPFRNALDDLYASNTQKGVLYFPNMQNKQSFFVFSTGFSTGEFPSIISVVVNGRILLADTMLVGDSTWGGGPNTLVDGQFALGSHPEIISSTARPMIYSVGGDVVMSDLTLTSQVVAGMLYVQDAGGIPSSTFERVNVIGSGTDFSGVGMVFRNNIAGAGNFAFRDMLLSAGPSQSDKSPTPWFYATQAFAPVTFERIMMSRRGIAIGSATTGIQASLDDVYCQGCFMPKLTLLNSTAAAGQTWVELRNSIEDTTTFSTIAYFGSLLGIIRLTGSNGVPTASNINGNGKLLVVAEGVGPGANRLGQNISSEIIAGSATAVDGTFNISTQQFPLHIYNEGLSIGTPYQAFVRSATQAAPSCSVSAGGTVAVASYTFQVAPVFPTGGEGSISPASTTCTTSGGNQTITINWAAVPGAIGYDLYVNGFSFQCSSPWVPGTQFSYVWNSVTPCGIAAPTDAGSGAASMTNGFLTSPSLRVAGANGGGYALIAANSITANRAQNLPDASGTFLLDTNFQNARFNVDLFGAKGDGKDCVFSLTAGSGTLTTSTCTFTAADIGKLVVIQGANGGLNAYASVITAFTNGTTVTINPHASTTTVSGVAGSYGTDNATAIAAAFTAAGAISANALVVIPANEYYLTSTGFTVPVNVSVQLDGQLQAAQFNTIAALLQSTTATVAPFWDHQSVFGIGILDLANIAFRGIWLHQGRHIDIAGINVRGEGLTNAIGVHVGDPAVGQAGGYETLIYNVSFGTHNASGGTNSRAVFIDNTTNGRFSDTQTYGLIGAGVAFGIYDGVGGGNHEAAHFWGPTLNTAFVDQVGFTRWTNCEPDTPSTYGWDLMTSTKSVITGGRCFLNTSGIDNTAICVRSGLTDPAVSIVNLIVQGADNTHRWASDTNLLAPTIPLSSVFGVTTTNVVTSNVAGQVITPAVRTPSIVLNGSNALTSVSGNSGRLAQSLGSLTAGHSATFDSQGNVVDSGGTPLVNPMTTLGDIIIEGAGPAIARLAGPTSPNSVPQTLVSTPSGGVAQAPAWLLAGVATNPQTGTSYTIAATDRLSYLSFSNAGAIAVTLPQAGTSGFGNNFAFVACAIAAGTATITPTTSTISVSNGGSYTAGAANIALTTGQCAWVYSDNTNYFAIRFSSGASVAFSAITNGTNTTATMTVGTGGTITTSGTGVVNANQINAAVVPTSAKVLSSNGSAQVIAATESEISAPGYAAGGGTAQAQTVTLAPAITAQAAGLVVRWLPSNANSGAGPTLAVNGLTAKTITKFGTTALVASDLTTTAIAYAIYDGTQYQLINPQTNTGGGGGGTTATCDITATVVIDDPRQCTSQFDEFDTGTAGNPNVGRMSWSNGGANGVVSYTNGVTGTYGVVQCAVPATTSSGCAILMTGAGSGGFQFPDYSTITSGGFRCRVNLSTVASPMQFFCGVTNVNSGSTVFEGQTDFIGIDFDKAVAGDTNWMIVHRASSGTITRTSTGVAATTGFHTLQGHFTAAGVFKGSIDGGAETTLGVTVTTTAALSPDILVNNAAVATALNFKLDYWQQVLPITR